MHVLHVLFNYEVTGVERHVEYLGLTQQEADDRVSVLCNSDVFPTSVLRSQGIEVVVDPQVAPEKPQSAAALATARHAAMKRIRDLDPDVVHVHTRRPGTVVVAPALSEGIPVVYTNHSLGCSPFLRAESLQGRRFPIIAVCEAGAEELRRTLGPQALIHHVPNGIRPTTPWESPSISIDDARPSIALIGGFNPVKGIDVALLALRMICDTRGPERTPILHIFGQGRGESDLRLLAAQLEIEDLVVFRGQHLGVVNARLGADVIVIPSREESTSLVLLEAMHAGIPVVASAVGGMAEVLPAEDFGLTVPVGSYEQIAQAIMDTLDRPDASAKRVKNAQARYWSDYTAELMAERTRAVYESAMRR